MSDNDENLALAAETICDSLNALIQTTAAAALLAHAEPDSVDAKHALYVLQTQLK